MSWYRKYLFEHHINVIIAVPELCLGMHKNKCWHTWVMLVSSLSNQLPYFAVPDCKAWHVRRARPRCASIFGNARLACTSTFSLHAWRGNEKYLLFEKYLLDKQLSAIPLKSGQQILKLHQSMKSCSTTHNKHRGSRSYLCSVSTTNYNVRAVPPISTNESHLTALFLGIWVLRMRVSMARKLS